MTDRKPDGDWSEDRLEAAFAARAAVAPATPRLLADDVLARLPQRGSSSRRWRWLAATAAAVAIVMVIGLGGLLDLKPSQPGPSAPTAAASDSTVATDSPATPAPTSAVLAALGDPVLRPGRASAAPRQCK